MTDMLTSMLTDPVPIHSFNKDGTMVRGASKQDVLPVRTLFIMGDPVLNCKYVQVPD